VPYWLWFLSYISRRFRRLRKQFEQLNKEYDEAAAGFAAERTSVVRLAMLVDRRLELRRLVHDVIMAVVLTLLKYYCSTCEAYHLLVAFGHRNNA
jgi:hypothetical protein